MPGMDDPAGQLVVYRSPSEETAPLLPGRTRPKLSRDGLRLILYGLLAFVAFTFISFSLYMHYTNCPLYPSEMEAIRRGWRKEAAQHQIAREEWGLEEQEHAIIEEEWKLQTERHERDVARQIREEDERQERVRQGWAQETERHARETEAYEEKVAHRAHEEQERQERVRKEWAREVEEHRRKYEEMERHENQRRENERRKWQHEVEDHDRIEEERRRREEEERQKLNMFWGDVEAHSTCISYATREYTAQLMNLPATWEHRVEACKATPLEVHGISYLPKSCEDRGPGFVIGRWEINQHEPDCESFWLWYKDKGCISPGSGRRRIEHYLENLPRGGDWREFCATTPAHFHGMEFSGAQECFQYNSGTYGHWQIDDPSCQ